MSAVKTIGTTLTKTTSPQMEVAGLTSIGVLGLESGEIDVTTLDSEGGYKEFIPGYKDSGELEIEGFVKSDEQFNSLFELAEDQTLVDWKVEFPDGSYGTFKGFVKSLKHTESTVEGVRGFTGAIRISGPITFYSAVSV